MGFSRIVPPAKPERVKVGTAMVRIAVSVNKKGNAKAVLSVADSQLTELGWDNESVTHVVIYEGTGDDYGKLRIEVAKDGEAGAVKVGKMKFGGARIYPPAFGCQPTKKIGALPCPVVSMDDKNGSLVSNGLVIELPLLDWSSAGVIAKREEKRQQAQQAAQVRQEETEGKLINVVGQEISGDVFCKPIEYLAKKGVQCAKMAGDWWQFRPMGGEAERVNTDELLVRINNFRKKNQLKPIGKHQLVQEAI